MKYFFTLFSLLLLLPLGSFAQSQYIGEAYYRLKMAKNHNFNNYIDIHNPVSTFSLYPQRFGHISRATDSEKSKLFFDASAYLYASLLRDSRYRNQFGAEFSPRIRMNDDTSASVRTPSYFIGVHDRFRVGSWTIPRLKGSTKGTRVFDFYLEAKMIHHSNGMELTQLIPGPKRQVRTLYGNFSTNYNEFSFGGMRHNIDDDINSSDQFKLGLQVHHDFPGGFDKAQFGYFGRWRVIGKYSWAKVVRKTQYVVAGALPNNKELQFKVQDDTLSRPTSNQLKIGKSKQAIPTGVKPIEVVRSFEALRLDLNASYIADELYKNPETDLKYGGLVAERFNLEGSVHVGINYILQGFNLSKFAVSKLSSVNASLFASVAYFGSDTYNIFYQDSFVMVKAGLSINPVGVIKF
jgi:hypothetical protein